MKSLIKAAVIGSVLAVPALSFAQTDAPQTDAPLTRAQVNADLAQFRQNAPRSGFGVDPYYPASTQAAEARIAAAQNGSAVAVGGVPNDGSSASGSRPSVTPGAKSIYFGQ
jgi:Domain of unknown function (DUF4148)